jgi:FKBP-type peptidyl-prolyl cis-trans isomerase 2
MAQRSLNDFLEPGMLVRHPDRDDWGLGQVQSVIGTRVTVNFENAGKVVIDGSRIQLQPDFG